MAQSLAEITFPGADHLPVSDNEKILVDGVEGVAGVENVEAIGGSWCRRKATICIVNLTSKAWAGGRAKLDSGKFLENPSASVPVDGVTSFRVSNRDNWPTGPEGTLTYTHSSKDDIEIYFEHPFKSTTSTYTARRLPPGLVCSLGPSKYEGFDQTVTLTITDKANTNRPYHNWMERYGADLGEKTLRTVTLPASHDAGTSALTDDINPVEAPSWLPEVEKYAGALFMPTLKHWSVAQPDSLKEQCMDGVRYLDLRCSYDAKSDTIRFSHMIFGANVLKELQGVRDFLLDKAHSKEIVMLEFKLFYNFTPALHSKLQNGVKDLFGSLLLDEKAFKSKPTIGALLSSGKRVVAFYPRGYIVVASDPFVSLSQVYSKWPEVEEPEALKARLDEIIPRGRTAGIFVLQCTCTPEAKTIITGLKPLVGNPATSLYGLSSKVFPLLQKWLTVDYKNTPLNILQFDWTGSMPVVAMCIQRNKTRSLQGTAPPPHASPHCGLGPAVALAPSLFAGITEEKCGEVYRFKVCFDDVIRRFALERSTRPFRSLHDLIVKLFALGKRGSQLQLQYTDDEGDVVRMSSDEELAEAFVCTNGVGGRASSFPPVLRLECLIE